MTDTPEVKIVENDAHFTIQAEVALADDKTSELVAEAVGAKKDGENSVHSFLHKLLAYVKDEFVKVGLDIETELKKL